VSFDPRTTPLPRAPRRSGEQLVVDPVACAGHGMCAELFPEWIDLDDWGYPMVSSDDVPAELREHADRAIKSCPTLALRLRKRA